MKKQFLKIAWYLAPVFICYVGSARESSPPAFTFIADQAETKDNYREPSTGLEFPPVLGGTKRGEVHVYDDPRLGLSIPYNSREMVITIYFYNLGLKTIGSGASSQVRKEIESNKAEIFEAKRQGIYQAVKHVVDKEVTLGSATNSPKAMHALFEIKRDNADKLSVIYLTGYKGQFLKIRCTYSVEYKTVCETVLQQFLNDLAKIMDGKAVASGVARVGEDVVWPGREPGSSL